MRPFRALFVAAAVLVLTGVGACSGVEGRCDRACDWQVRCVQGSVSMADCTSSCVSDADNRSDDCEDAFDDFADCADENQSCPGVDKQCQREAARLIDKCDCENSVGPLAELCAIR